LGPPPWSKWGWHVAQKATPSIFFIFLFLGSKKKKNW